MYCVFTYDAFIKNNESMMKVQHLFRIHFNIRHRGAVSNRKTIMKWVTAFRTTEIITKKSRTSSPERTVTTPENTERIQAAFLQSPWRSVHKQAQARYIDMVNNFLKPELHKRRRTIKLLNSWFQQDGALLHTAIASMDVVCKMFSDC